MIDWIERVQWCEAAGMTRHQVAAHCGMSYTALGDVMSRQTKEPRGTAAVKLYQLSEAHKPTTKAGKQRAAA